MIDDWGADSFCEWNQIRVDLFDPLDLCSFFTLKTKMESALKRVCG